MLYEDSETLVKDLREGKEEAYSHIIDVYSQRLFGYALTLTSDHAMAQDIVQNVYLKTWEKRKNINIHTSLQNYLFKSVQNEFLNQYKKRRSKMILEHKYFKALENTTSLVEEKSFDDLIKKITKEVQNLPPKCREIFLMSRREGLTNLEISEYLNISIKTVEAQITKSFSVLREKLGDEYTKVINLFFLFDSLSMGQIPMGRGTSYFSNGKI